MKNKGVRNLFRVSGILAKDGHPRVGAVEHVIHIPAQGGSLRSYHVKKLTRSPPTIKKKVPDMLSRKHWVAS